MTHQFKSDNTHLFYYYLLNATYIEQKPFGVTLLSINSSINRYTF